MTRVEILGYVVVALVLGLATFGVGLSAFSTDESVHHFSSSERDPFSNSFIFLFVLVVVVDVYCIRWLIGRLRGHQ